MIEPERGLHRRRGAGEGGLTVIELRQIRVFVAVAEELHFGHAAERLFIPQSVVSEQVKRLERALKVQLFDRSRRSVRLTPAGADLLQHAYTLLAAEQQLTDAARASQRRQHVLKLGIGRGLGRRLTVILRALAATGQSVRTVSAPPPERTLMVERGEIDAAIIRGRVRSNLGKTHVWDARLVAALPEHHPLFDRDTVSVAELAQTPVALVPRDVNPALHDLINGALAAEGASLRTGIPFTNVASTFAEPAAAATPMWTPVFDAYEAEHGYEGIHVVRIDPPLTMPSFLIAAERLSGKTREALIEACRTSGSSS